jgi:hemoglobin-like flavoprotein
MHNRLIAGSEHAAALRARFLRNRWHRSRQFIDLRSNLAFSASTNNGRSNEFVSTMKAEIMSPEHKQILKNTWAMVAPISDTAAGLFYDRLFTLDPSLKPLFAKADMQEQRRKLMQAIAAVINGVDHLDALVPTLEALGRNHRGYGVTDRHYETVGAALLWTLEQGLKDAWTPAAKSAWTAAYTTVATVMRRAAAAAKPVV